MFRGEPDSKPFLFRRYSDIQQVLADWRKEMAQLRGRRLLEVHAQWEEKVPGPAGWWVDGPVLLNFEGTQLELGAICCEFSVSLDTFKLKPDEVYGDEDTGKVIWRTFPWTELEHFRGLSLCCLRAVEGGLDNDHKFKGVSFHFERGAFCFYDAGDELGVTWASLPDDPTLSWRLGQRF